MAREAHDFPDQIGSRCGQWVLTAFRTNPRRGRSSFARVVIKGTEETVAASAAPSTRRHVRFAILALNLVATAQGWTDGDNKIPGASLTRLPIRTVPEGLLTENGYHGVPPGRSRLGMVTGGSNGVDPDLRLIEGGVKRRRGSENFDSDVKPEPAVDTTDFKSSSTLGALGVSQEEQERGMGRGELSIRRLQRGGGDGDRNSDVDDDEQEGDGDESSESLLDDEDEQEGDGDESSESLLDDEDEEEGDGDESSQSLLVIVSIVVGCGVMLLVVLCVVRKVMDLCLLRYDPTGSISYSQEEGLPKAIIERLPQTRYKKPPPKPHSKLAKVWSKQDRHFTAGASVFGDDAVVALPEPKRAPDSIPVPAGATDEGEVKVKARDSTEDMCAICLVDYEHGDELRVIPGCNHHFHKECIDPWLETKAVCAYCKAKVEARKSCCDRVMGSASNRLGIRFVAPTTIRFSSSRRTYTNQDVEAMGPSLPPSYGRSDVDYVGSMVDSGRAGGNGGDEETGATGHGIPTAVAAAGGEVIGIPGSNSGSGGGSRSGAMDSASGRSLTRSSDVGEDGERGPQGTIVVQPVAGSSFVVVPRGFSTASSAGSCNSDNVTMSMSNESAAAAAAAVAASRVAPPTTMVEGSSGAAGDSKEEEKWEGDRPVVRTIDRTAMRRRSERLQRPTRGRSRGSGGSNRRARVGGGVMDGLGGVVFGGNTQEFKEAEAEDRARQRLSAGGGSMASGGVVMGGGTGVV